MELTYEWQKYDGDYQKKIQDIKLKNGDVVEFCYPNAGMWNCMQKEGNGKYYDKFIQNSDVEYVRLNYKFYNWNPNINK